ncbi:hypothetical protein ElyMa_002834000 [Elysia marginata]|uniref:Uncharacterized protein n=1 Tax=Elysia marginata TaxID=1093978 RepID=A0AAV4HX26_9GAST|nr:hypothetical protein ElyMa_002834000 [Elysia marginata]
MLAYISRMHSSCSVTFSFLQVAKRGGLVVKGAGVIATFVAIGSGRTSLGGMSLSSSSMSTCASPTDAPFRGFPLPGAPPIPPTPRSEPPKLDPPRPISSPPKDRPPAPSGLPPP